MYILSIVFIFITTLSLIITYLSINIKKTSKEIVNDMGIGWNLGKTFESYIKNKKIESPMEQITLFGNNIPSKKMISNIKKYGIKTIRIPVTWIYFIDESGNINPEWISILKKVVNMIIKEKMYCILNIHHDTSKGNWLGEGTNSKDKYINLWKNIANEFKYYNEYLVFESFDDIEYSFNSDFMNIFYLNDAFIKTVRDSGGKNGDRLLILSGVNKDISLTCSPEYKLPIDPSKRFAISIHFYIPEQFSIEPDESPWTWNDNGVERIIEPKIKWGDENDYKDMVSNFETLKETFLDKEIPVIIVEVGVLTEQKKDPESIVNYLHFEFSLSSVYNGLMSCLFDNSNKEKGEMNYYDRENDLWYNEKIGENLKAIYHNKFINPTDYFIFSNSDTVSTITSSDTLVIRFGKKKVLKVIFNVYIKINNRGSVGFGISSSDSSGTWCGEGISGELGKKKYDGSFTFNIDVSKKDYTDQIEIQKW